MKLRHFVTCFFICLFLMAGQITVISAGSPSTHPIPDSPPQPSSSPPSSSTPPPPASSSPALSPTIQPPMGLCQDADGFMKRGQVKKAFEVLDKCIAKNPKNAALYLKRGNFRAMEGKLSDAIRDFSKAILINPRSYTAYELRGMAKIRIGKSEEGLKDIERAMALNPRSPQLLARKGSILISMGKKREAIDVYTEAIKLSPKFFGNYISRGSIYESLGDYDRALKDYDRAIELEPAFPPLHFVRGIARFCDGQFRGAAADFKISYGKSKKDEQSGLMLALALMRMGNGNKAKEVFKNLERGASKWNKPIAALFLKKISPSDFIRETGKAAYQRSAYWGFLGEYYLLHQEKKKAEASFRQCISLDPNCVSIPCRFAKAEIRTLKNK